MAPATSEHLHSYGYLVMVSNIIAAKPNFCISDVMLKYIMNLIFFVTR